MSLRFRPVRHGSESVEAKILRKHILAKAEPFGRLCEELPQQANEAKDSPDKRRQVLARIGELVMEQAELAVARPLYAQMRVRRRGGTESTEQKRIGPSGLLVIVKRSHHSDVILSAYFVAHCHNWRASCHWLLDKYCRARGGSYQIPALEEVFEINSIERRREDRVRLHDLKTFGILTGRVTSGARISFPQWQEAEKYDSTGNSSLPIKRAVRPCRARNPSKPRSL